MRTNGGTASIDADRFGPASARRAVSSFDAKRAVEGGQRTLSLEASAIRLLADALSGPLAAPFVAATRIMLQARGRIIVTGMGKSGHVGQKIAATFASTGSPAFFVHPSEASHGDLGMITRDDVILALSKSGETVELTNILTYARRFGVPLVSITARTGSALAKASDVVLQLPEAEEACPHGLAPTTSTTMQLALGDSLAVALLEARGFTAHDFKVFHPGGSLGAQLSYVRDLMHSRDEIPLAGPDTLMSDAIVSITQKSFGCLGIVDADGKLIGVLTDGDLRRHMRPDLLSLPVRDIMTRQPKWAAPDVLASEALDLINRSRITALFVLEDGVPVGIVHVHDLLRAGVA